MRRSHVNPLINAQRIDINKKSIKMKSSTGILIASCSFIVGCILTAVVLLSVQMNTNANMANSEAQAPQIRVADIRIDCPNDPSTNTDKRRQESIATSTDAENEKDSTMASVLHNLKVLVAIVAFDFSQLPHFEEVLQAYHDLCVAGSFVDVVVHATVAYPVTLIDLLNTRLACPHFTLTIVLKPKTLRLFLVNQHRKLFYDKIDEYDLFIYSEDDIRTTPTTVAMYMTETLRIQTMLLSVDGTNTNKRNEKSKQLIHPSDFNVGIVRYEYNFPANVIMDDNTRHATQNVTRVYWEHSGFERPVVGNAVQVVSQHPLLKDRYITMQNHHQGMFLATRELLLAWKDRPKCDFSNARKRPGTKKGQPTEGTQRVWMSSQMLYGGRHCGVQQVLPKDSFGSLTVLHLPNKNYRRVGKYQNRQFSDGTEVFEQPHESLLTAMELHVAVRRELPSPPQYPYRGIRMIDDVDKAQDRTPLLERRMLEFQEYTKRGGVLSEDDMEKIDLVEES